VRVEEKKMVLIHNNITTTSLTVNGNYKEPFHYMVNLFV